MPVVSVIIPNYNHASYLEQRVKTVLNQTYDDFEIIILDDFSLDHSKEIISKYKDHPKVSQLVFNTQNSGSTFKQWEKGIALAKGEYVWIAESDDYSHPEFLEAALKNLKKYDCSLTFCQSDRVDEDSNNTGDYFHWTEDVKSVDWLNPFFMKGETLIKNALKYKNVIPNASAVVFRKKEFDFNKIINYKMKGDWLFWINYLMSENVCYSPQKLNYYRWHPNTTRNEANNLKAVRSRVEELGIKYFLYQEGYVNRQQVKYDLYKSIDISLPYFKEYKRICLEISLPRSFIFYFFIRKSCLKVKRIISTINHKK